MEFPFNQPAKTKDCGYRCLYYVLDVKEPYFQWLKQFQMFDPPGHGILVTDIAQVLKYHRREFKVTQLAEAGLFIVLSGAWLKHTHYFVYHDGFLLCSTLKGPVRMSLSEVVARLETSNTDHGFKVIQVFPPGVSANVQPKPWENQGE